MKFLSVPNLNKHQHYKDRRPPWIKLHASLLSDYDFSLLTDQEKYQIIGIWLLASQLDNKIPHNEKWLCGQIQASKINLKKFIELHMLERHASDMIADGYQSDVVETEAYTTDREERENCVTSGKPDSPVLKNGVAHQMVEIIDHLNATAGRKFQLSAATQSKLKARFKEGFSTEDLKAVIDDRNKRWGKDGKMQEYIRPATLFGAKCSDYLGMAGIKLEGAKNGADEWLEEQQAQDNAINGEFTHEH